METTTYHFRLKYKNHLIDVKGVYDCTNFKINSIEPISKDLNTSEEIKTDELEKHILKTRFNK